MNNWIILTILYAIFIAFHESANKKAVEKNSVYEVLAIFSTAAFLLVALFTKDAFTISYNNLLLVIIKSVIVLCAWICGLKSIKQIEISIYGMINISTIIFATLLSYFFLNESISITTIIGMLIIIIGLVLVNKTTNKEENKKNKISAIILALLSSFFNSISAILDKVILLRVTSSQLQFWFLLFLMIFYWIILMIKKNKIDIKKLSKNYWIYISAICLVLGDRFLFLANENINSQVIIMTMLKRITVIVSIILGKYMFKEKEIIKKLLYSILIIIGIIIMTVL